MPTPPFRPDCCTCSAPRPPDFCNIRVHQTVWGVTGNLGDSQCYLGVTQKVEAIQASLARRIERDDLPVRLIPPAYTIGVSDGSLNGTDRMRFSLIGREIVNDSIDIHLSGSDVKGLIAVVACDKPPIGTLAAVLEHNEPAVLIPDGPIKPGIDPTTGETRSSSTSMRIASTAGNSLTPPSTRDAQRLGRTPCSGTEASIRR